MCPPGSECQVEVCRCPSREIVFGLRPRHPWGPSLDHIVPLADGGPPFDEWNLRPAHLGCNAARRPARAPARRARSGRTAALPPVDITAT